MNNKKGIEGGIENNGRRESFEGQIHPSVERGKSFIRNRLEAAAKSIISHFQPNPLITPQRREELSYLSATMAMLGANYLFIRQKVFGQAFDPMLDSLQNFISNDLPQIFSSLKNAEPIEWDVKRNVAALDTIMFILTLVFSITAIKEAVLLALEKFKNNQREKNNQ